jgi:hypothetical protein
MSALTVTVVGENAKAGTEMPLEHVTCFDCGDTGHVAADCPNKAITPRNGKPPWCGICDERTRHIGIDHPGRCPECHPLRRQQLKQHRKCPACHMTVCEWDNAPCGQHATPAATTDRRPDRQHIDAIIAAGKAAP